MNIRETTLYFENAHEWKTNNKFGLLYRALHTVRCPVSITLIILHRKVWICTFYVKNFYFPLDCTVPSFTLSPLYLLRWIFLFSVWVMVSERLVTKLDLPLQSAHCSSRLTFLPTVRYSLDIKCQQNMHPHHYIPKWVELCVPHLS